MDIMAMDCSTEAMFRKACTAFGCALIGRFITMYREAYGAEAALRQITSFCVEITMQYDGKQCSINSNETTQLIKSCMEKIRSGEYTYISPFEKGKNDGR